VEGGFLRIHGVPLAQTDFQCDPRSPARESHVPTLVSTQTRRSVGHLPLETVTQGEAAIRRALQDSEAELVVADAAETEHLYALARAVAHMRRSWLCCGSAGLAEGWLHALGLTRPAAEPFCWPPRSGPVLVIAGSRHPMTAAQLREAQAQRDLQLVCLSLAAGDDSAQWLDAVHMLAEGHHVALTTAFTPYQPGNEIMAPAYLARAAARVCANVETAGLILTGGDTANAVCVALGMVGLEVVGEVQPGIPAARGIGGPGDGLRLVTKAGAFGDEYTLIRGMDFLQGVDGSPCQDR